MWTRVPDASRGRISKKRRLTSLLTFDTCVESTKRMSPASKRVEEREVDVLQARLNHSDRFRSIVR